MLETSFFICPYKVNKSINNFFLLTDFQENWLGELIAIIRFWKFKMTHFHCLANKFFHLFKVKEAKIKFSVTGYNTIRENCNDNQLT